MQHKKTHREPIKHKSHSLLPGHLRKPEAIVDYVYGKNPVTEAIKAGRRQVHEILFSESTAQFQNSPLYHLISVRHIPCQQVQSRELDRLFPDAVHQNIAARVQHYPDYYLSEVFEDTADKKLVLALDCIQDPQNFGTLCRSALAFGVHEIIIPQDRSASVTAVVCKASAGAVEHLRVISVTNLSRALDEFKKNGYWVYGACLDNRSVELKMVKPAAKSVVVLGNEGSGLRKLVAESCDELVKIKMKSGFDSLNVAQAGTVMLYAFS